MSRILPVPNVSGVVAGGTAIIDLPPGDTTYRDVVARLAASAGTFDDTKVNGTRITLDGDVLQRYLSAADFKAICNFYGENPGPTAQIRIPFSRSHLRQAAFSDLFGQGVRGLTSFQIELDIDATAAAAGVPSMFVHRRTFSRATEQQPAANVPGMVLRVVPYQKTVSSAGDHDFIGLLKSGALAGVHIKGANVTAVELDLNDLPRWKLNNATVMETFAESTVPPRVRQANWWHLDFMENDNLDDQLVVRDANDLRLSVTTSAGDDLVVYAMYLERYTPNGAA